MMAEQKITELLKQANDLYQKGQTDKAIEIWRSIKCEDSPEQYAKAQFNLGVALRKQGKTEEAIEIWRSIKCEDSPEQYAKAQFNLGVALRKQGKTEEAIEIWRSIKHKDSSELYAKAQFNLGVILGKQGDIEGEIAAYCNIKREYSLKQYAKAQVNLGVALRKQGKFEEAIEIWRSIKCEDSPEQYAKAQFNLGVALRKQGKTEEAIKAYRSVEHGNFPDLYAKAQFNIGVLLFNKDETKAKRAFENSKSVFYYQSESRLKILNCSLKNRSNLKEVYDDTSSIIKNLFISGNEEATVEEPLKVAHYTRPSIARVLVTREKDNTSSLRLSTVKNTNDPTEGKVLYSYLHRSCGLPRNVLDAAQESGSQALAAFISCFTFNHDSLNQFRLYGKEDGLEASGVSLVFEKSFFSAEDPFAIMTAAPAQENIDDGYFEQPDKNTRKKLGKLPLYRCIYIDPQSGYVSVAHRDKVTFYAEAWHGKKTAVHKDICEEAEKRWKEYQTKIDQRTKAVKNDLSELTKKIQAVAKDAENDVLQTLAFILQPLRYLMKHAAFQEEQECRILYIGNLPEDKRIHTDWDSKLMYIEYDASVRDSLDKIYLSPGAEPYADFFKCELPNQAQSGGIRSSQNPFRNK